jgi:hypothetical protein
MVVLVITSTNFLHNDVYTYLVALRNTRNYRKENLGSGSLFVLETVFYHPLKDKGRDGSNRNTRKKT